jgi:hypothetical protein
MFLIGEFGVGKSFVINRLAKDEGYDKIFLNDIGLLADQKQKQKFISEALTAGPDPFTSVSDKKVRIVVLDAGDEQESSTLKEIVSTLVPFLNPFHKEQYSKKRKRKNIQEKKRLAFHVNPIIVTCRTIYAKNGLARLLLRNQHIKCGQIEFAAYNQLKSNKFASIMNDRQKKKLCQQAIKLYLNPDNPDTYLTKNMTQLISSSINMNHILSQLQFLNISDGKMSLSSFKIDKLSNLDLFGSLNKLLKPQENVKFEKYQNTWSMAGSKLNPLSSYTNPIFNAYPKFVSNSTNVPNKQYIEIHGNSKLLALGGKEEVDYICQAEKELSEIADAWVTTDVLNQPDHIQMQMFSTMKNIDFRNLKLASLNKTDVNTKYAPNTKTKCLKQCLIDNSQREILDYVAVMNKIHQNIKMNTDTNHVIPKSHTLGDRIGKYYSSTSDTTFTLKNMFNNHSNKSCKKGNPIVNDVISIISKFKKKV